MPIVEWNAGSFPHCPEMDQYHQYLVQLLNNLYDAFTEGIDIPPSVITNMILSSTDQFLNEERMMTDACFPDFDQHKEEHLVFIGKLLKLQNSGRQQMDRTVELLWFLCNWVTRHLRETDAALCRFLESAGTEERRCVNGK